jgi:hypothetical protein
MVSISMSGPAPLGDAGRDVWLGWLLLVHPANGDGLFTRYTQAGRPVTIANRAVDESGL